MEEQILGQCVLVHAATSPGPHSVLVFFGVLNINFNIFHVFLFLVNIFLIFLVLLLLLVVFLLLFICALGAHAVVGLAVLLRHLQFSFELDPGRSRLYNAWRTMSPF